MPEIVLINPRMGKVLSEDQVADRQEKAVRFAREVLGNDELADELEELTVEEYAERKGFQLNNPNRKGVRKMRNANSVSERRDELADRVDAIEKELDKIAKGAKKEPESTPLFNPRAARQNPRTARQNPRAESVEEELLTERDEILESLQDARGAIRDGELDEAEEILDEILDSFDMEDGEEVQADKE
jgi:hypothetical protein